MPLPGTRDLAPPSWAEISSTGSSLRMMRNCSPDLPRKDPDSERIMRGIF